MKPEDKVTKLEEIIKLLNEGLTKKDFEEAFELVTKIVKDLKVTNAREFELMKRSFDLLSKKVRNGVEVDVESARKEMLEICTMEIKSMLKQVKSKLFEADEKIRSLRGRDKADEEKIIKSIERLEKKIPKIPDPLTASQIADELESLNGAERLKIEAIHELREELDELKKMIKKVQTSGGGIGGGMIGRDFIKDVDISSQLNGVLKTFNIPAVWNVISVHMSSFPHALRKNTDFTYTGTTITFTSEIDAASSLAAGQTCVLTVVTA